MNQKESFFDQYEHYFELVLSLALFLGALAWLAAGLGWIGAVFGILVMSPMARLEISFFNTMRQVRRARAVRIS